VGTVSVSVLRAAAICLAIVAVSASAVWAGWAASTARNPRYFFAPATAPSAAVHTPNNEVRGDKLAVAVHADPAPPSQPNAPAAETPLTTGAIALQTPATDMTADTPAAEPAKTAAKLPTHAPAAVLAESQIASIKDRLKLTSAQEAYWPDVEQALRGVLRHLRETHKRAPRGTAAAVDINSPEIQRLQKAAQPLVAQLRDDQKREVRMIARLIGLDSIAAQL
jgi:hypothetical protein